ncbi:MAG: alanine dehydrogenase [Novosphingobium sp.]
MHVGTVREVMDNEYRVGLTPESVREIVAHGHAVWVESGAGQGIGASDGDYEAAGATIAADAAEVYARCELMVKVKEPQPAERAMLRAGQVVFTYLHLAPDPQQAADLIASGVTAIAYETVTGPNNSLPLLRPMSQVAGRMSVQAGATALEKGHGGRGILLGGVPGVAPGKVVVIGGGVVGFNAAQVAVGMGADVTILDRDPEALERLGVHFEGRARTRFSNRANIAACLAEADLVIGAVLVPGGAAPKLVTRDMLATMKAGAVLVDVAIDQGGCFETSRPTTHSHPTFILDGVVHYCVSNMPGAVARTSTYALNNVTLPHVLQIAEHGWKAAMAANPHLAAGLNIHGGKVVHPAVAQALGYAPTPLADVLS